MASDENAHKGDEKTGFGFHSTQASLTDDWQDYALLDSGDGLKLERFGPYSFIRPEPQALWSKRLDDAIWQKAAGRFVASSDDPEKGGRWHLSDKLPARWEMSFETIRFYASPTPFRHLAFFPEQSAHWQFCADKIKTFKDIHGRAPRILNLFAYTGAASLHAAAAGAEVTHIDASKKAIAQAFENRDLSDLQQAPIRFITDDCSKFVAREVRRENRYDGIILDPPKYGRGPKGEVWRLEETLPDLLQQCRSLLSDDAIFMVLTIYAIRTSTLAVHSAMADALNGRSGNLTSGELAIAEAQDNPRAIGQALFVRWENEALNAAPATIHKG